MIKNFVKDGLIYAIPTFISRGMSIILVPIYTRILSTSDYGILDLLTITGTFVGMVISMELTQSVARFYSSEKDVYEKKKYFSTAFWIILATYTSSIIIALLLRNTINHALLGRDSQVNILVAGLVFIWSNGILTYLHNHFRWQLRSKEYAVLSVTSILLTASLGVILAYAFKMGLFGLLVAMSLSNVICSIMCIYLQKSEFIFSIDSVKFVEMAKFSIPLIPSSISVMLSNYIDRFMINHYLSLDELGIYSLGFKLANIIALVIAGFQISLTPLVYTYHEDKNTPNSLAAIFRYFISASLIMYFCIVSFSQEILKVFTTEQFYSADAVIVFLIPSIILSSMYIFTPGASIKKKTHIILLVNVLGAFVNFLLNSIFIPRYGLQGAAIATLLSALIVFVTNMWFSQKMYPVNYPWNRIILAVLATVLLIVITNSITTNYYLSLLIRIAAVACLVAAIISEQI